MERFFKQLTAFLAIAFLVIVVSLAAFSGRNRIEIARLEQNCLALTDSVKAYRVSDSLNAVQAKALRLTASEYKELYASEHELVKSLRADKVGLLSTIALQQKTVLALQSDLQPVCKTDTVMRHDTTPVIVHDTIYCFSYKDKWVDLSGCVEDSVVNIDLTTYDELLIVESAQRKRFLGIPLSIKLFGYKYRTLDAINMNPNARITNVTYKT
ncbi:MAG: hypothetical protein II630_03100, partial [Bacteroidales bacterium]|nr:hypothetical protein [Bacteroidales bacterium]